VLGVLQLLLGHAGGEDEDGCLFLDETYVVLKGDAGRGEECCTLGMVHEYCAIQTKFPSRVQTIAPQIAHLL
jgi:hypothetical protein